MIRYVFASKREAAEFRKNMDIVPKGEISVLEDGLPMGDGEVWVHVGYCAGNGVGIGVLVEPPVVYDEESGESIRINPIFPLEHRVCVNRKEDSTKGYLDIPSVYDGSLFRIAEMNHKRLHAIKIVSHSVDGSANHGKDGGWIRAAEILRDYLKE